MRSRIVLVVAVSAMALAPLAVAGVRTQGATHPQTTEPPTVWDIHVTLTDSRIALNRHSAPRGDVARFIMRNTGRNPHSFTIGTAARGTGVQTGFSHMLKPKQRKIVFLFLDYRGEIRYYSKLPADRSKPGMKGTFRIT